MAAQVAQNQTSGMKEQRLPANFEYLRPHAKGGSTPTGAGRYPWAQPGCGSAGMRARRNGSASVKIRRRRKVSGLSTMFRLAPHADTTTAPPRAKMPKFTPCLHMTEQLRRNSGV